MSDWTTPEDVPEVVRERLHDWLNTGNHAHATTLANFAVAEVIRAFWPAPARTLADDLAHIAEHWEEWATDTIIEELTAATTRAEKMEQDAEERQEWNRNITKQVATLARDRDEARALAERLAAENENLRRTDNYKEFKEFLGVQKGAESNAESTAESIDPADVEEEEPYHIYYGVYGNDHTVGVRIGGKWRCIGDDNGVRVTDDNIVSLTRLVPAPRVITDPDELDRLAESAVVLSLSTQYALQRRDAGGEWYCQATKGKATSADVISCGPVTVLWEPVA